MGKNKGILQRFKHFLNVNKEGALVGGLIGGAWSGYFSYKVYQMVSDITIIDTKLQGVLHSGMGKEIYQSLGVTFIDKLLYAPVWVMGFFTRFSGIFMEEIASIIATIILFVALGISLGALIDSIWRPDR